MELRHLRYFVALAEELHFGRAAEKVFVAQSTLSGQIKKLEEELQVRLFERTKRSVKLTETGRTFLPFARQTLRDAERAEEAARRAERGLMGTLRISYGTGFMDDLSEVILAFRKQVPDVKLELLERGGHRAQVDALRAEDVDVSFGFPPVDERGLRTLQVSEAPAVVVLPEEHRLAGRRCVPLRELAGEPHVLWARDMAPRAYDNYVRACHEVGFSPDVVQEVRHVESLLGLVAAGLGVSVASGSTAQIQRPGVAYAILSEPSILVPAAVAWREGDEAPALERFLRVVREVTVAGEETNV